MSCTGGAAPAQLRLVNGVGGGGAQPEAAIRRRAAAAAAAVVTVGGGGGGGAAVAATALGHLDTEQPSARDLGYRRASSGESSLDGDQAIGFAALDKVNEEEVSRGEVVAYNMVAAMNEHLSSASTTGTVKDKVKDQIKEKEKSEIAAEDSSKAVGILGFPCDFDHMYASMTDGGAPATATSALGVSPLRGNEARQNDLTEVKHLKELLLLHLDLIQQQSEQIVTKDKLLAALRQENETLKLRLERMDRRVNLQKMRSENAENTDHVGPCSPPSLSVPVNSLPSTSEHHKIVQSESVSPPYNESFKIRLNTTGGVTTVKQELSEKQECKQETMGESWESKKKRKSDAGSVTTSIKRKRGVSSSSTISNDTSSTLPETLGGKGPNNEILKKSEKKGKSLMKKENFLTTEEHYYTAIGEANYTLTLKDRSSPDPTTVNNLEVPSWRIKVYTSCYTMEGTENNLDDEIFNKRHLKLENDERRRKRWDVQRIREQRHIEKLKQRQERQSHHATCYNLNHTGPCIPSTEEENVTTLWPDLDQIQSIQVDTRLPISAFGTSVPCFSPCDFSLPWLVNLKSKARRPKRSNSRRRKSSRR